MHPDYSRLSWDDCFAARTKLAKRVEAEIAPDYLSIGNEPSTEMMVLGKKGLTEARYAKSVADTLAARLRAADRGAVEAMLARQASPSGRAYSELIRETSRPAAPR